MAIVPNRKTPKQAQRKTPKHPTSTTLTTPRVFLYMRVSTEDQADHGTIDAQRDFLRHYTALYQLPVVGEMRTTASLVPCLLENVPKGSGFSKMPKLGLVTVYSSTDSPGWGAV